jgi:hypothetical protein
MCGNQNSLNVQNIESGKGRINRERGDLRREKFIGLDFLLLLPSKRCIYDNEFKEK